MKRIIIASHHNFAKGLKETLNFLTTMNDIYDITAYVEQDEPPLEKTVAGLMESFDREDKVVIMTDCMAGSVNQKFYPYMNDHVFLLTGVNVPLGMAVMLQSEEDINQENLHALVEDARSELIFVNEYQAQSGEDDE